MNEHNPTIATLPLNPYPDSPPSPIILMESPNNETLIKSVDYSPKSFIVFGDATKIHIKYLLSFYSYMYI